MILGRTLTIFVMGKSPSCLKSVEIGNRTLKAYIGSRTHLSELRQISELSEPAVYFLLDESAKDGLSSLYVGETDDFSRRLSEHASNSDKNWWENFIVFVGRNLTKAHVKYLEKELYDLAKSSTAIKIMNSPKKELGLSRFGGHLRSVLYGVQDARQTNTETIS